MKGLIFYLGLSLLFTHELDAVTNHEWRVLPLTSWLEDSLGELVFILIHIPLFAVIIGFIASLNRTIRNRARSIASGFLILHGVLHFLFSRHQDYEFSSVLSSALIYGAAACGVIYFSIQFSEGRAGDV